MDNVATSFVGGKLCTVEPGITGVGDTGSTVGGGVGLGLFRAVGDGVSAESPPGEQAHRIKVQKTSARRILGILR